MSRRDDAFSADFSKCRWINLDEALHHFGTYDGKTQSQQHIKPLHWYVASRLVVEGGFHPDEITPRPPFRATEKAGKWILEFDPSMAKGGERAILGGMKTKNVDVVVTKDGIGPVLAISCKGMQGAFRNLTNRMEETIGECTNLHITYPALVFGYMFVIRANKTLAQRASDVVSTTLPPSRLLAANDIALKEGGEPVESIARFHSALRELTGRRGIRNDVSRYEAIALALVEIHGDSVGSVMENFPPTESPLRIEKIFQTLYQRYEERFLIGAPDLKAVTRRIEWEVDSPALQKSTITPSLLPDIDYERRTRD